MSAAVQTMSLPDKRGKLETKKSFKGLGSTEQVHQQRQQQQQQQQQKYGIIRKKDDQRIVSPENLVFQDAAKEKEIRRIIAEDPSWNLEVVKELRLQCLDYIIANFTEVSYLLNKLPLKAKSDVLQRLPISLPLSITFPLIDDQNYWSRCSKAKWRVCDVAKHGRNWKRLYAEKTMQEMIENYMPGSSSFAELQKMLDLVKVEIVELNIRQMLPLLKYLQKNGEDVTSQNDVEDKDVNDDDDDSEDARIEHLNLALLLPKMLNLESLQVNFIVKDCGMNFDWNLFKFTSRDCYNLSKCISTECGWLKSLNLSNNNIDDEKIRIFIGNILDKSSLEHLNLSHNKISNSGARAIAKLLMRGGEMRRLQLADNQIQTDGAKALAHALTVNTKLTELNLRLNRLGDEGVSEILEALKTNSSLEDLDLSACEMTEDSAAILREAILENTKLRSLNISANKLDEKSGPKLLEAVNANESLTSLDFRQTNLSKEYEIQIIDKIKRNKDQQTDHFNNKKH